MHSASSDEGDSHDHGNNFDQGVERIVVGEGGEGEQHEELDGDEEEEMLVRERLLQDCKPHFIYAPKYNSHHCSVTKRGHVALCPRGTDVYLSGQHLALALTSKSLQFMTLAYQASFNDQMKKRMHRYLAIGLRAFRSDLLSHEIIGNDATLIAGILLCSIGVKLTTI